MRWDMRFFLPLLAIISLLTSCGPKVVFEEVQAIDGQSWSHEDSLTYRFHQEDLTTFFDIVLKIEHSVDYAWENLYLEINTVFPDSVRTSQRLPIDLADLTGIWKGDCGKESCTLEIDLAKGNRFQHAGDYTITLVQEGREDPLEGILSMALKVVHSK
jgi:gliding motility-associated lipoprotein GldH